ncbi:hypothetical protein IVE04_24175 [Pseudomonas mendocina]|nr:hypothetical protein [Pseudomonas mendocina]
MSTTKTSARLTPNMRWVLQGICAGKPHDHGCSGRSEYGARVQTLIALRCRGLIDEQNEPTAAGLAMFPPAQATPADCA